MRKLPLLLFLVLIVSVVRGQVVRPSRPFCVEDPRLTQRSLKAIRKSIRDLTAPNQNLDSRSLCVLAELLKRIGHLDAERYYKAAIELSPSDAEYELMLADYLRNVRGPQRPLFARAERHYLEALRKVNESLENNRQEQLRRRIERGLIALYQEDGAPLDEQIDAEWPGTIEKPVFFFASINEGARSVGDLERVDEVRSYTGEALFAASRARLNRPLSAQELSALIRPKLQFETLNRFRFRPDDWPAVDFFGKKRRIDDAQITNFFRPGEFNRFSLSDFGISVEKAFTVPHNFDAYLKATIVRSERKGLIEFLPDRVEKVNEVQVTAAASRFVGPDKIVFETTYSYQDINPQIANPPNRNRQIIGGIFSYHLFRPIPFLAPVYSERFRLRGLRLSAGAVADRERFGNVALNKTDLFVGASLNGLGRVDLTLQPTLFKGRVTGDSTQSNSQYRTNLNLLYRLLDEEREPGIPKKKFGVHWAFVHLVLPLKHDVALTGLKEFENYNFWCSGECEVLYCRTLPHDIPGLFSLQPSALLPLEQEPECVFSSS